MGANLSLRTIAIATACVASFMACATSGVSTDDTIPGVPGEGDSGAGAKTDTGTTPAKDSGGTTPTDSSMPSDTGTTADTGPADSGPIIVDSGKDTGVDSGVVTDAGSTCVKPPPSAVCGAAPQCGCTGTQTCDVTNPVTGAMACVASGAALMGRPCTTTGNCATGLTCWSGTCHNFCNNPGANCVLANTTACFTPDQPPPAVAGTPSINLNVCAVSCDPRVPATQCGAAGCLWFSGSKLSDCRAVNGLPILNPCSYLNDCSPGLQCGLHPVFGYECEKWCRIGVAGDCAAGFTCTNVYGAGAPVIGMQTLGLCQD